MKDIPQKLKRHLLRFFTVTGVVVVTLLFISLIGLLWFAGEKPVPDPVVLELNLDQGFLEYVPDDPLAQVQMRDKLVFRDVIEGLQRAREDDRVKGLVARVGPAPVGLAQVQELRDAIKAFRKTGRFAVVYSESLEIGGQANSAYYLATAFEEILLQPIGGVGLNGVRYETPFLRGTLDKLGIVPRIDHRKEYKNAKNMLTEKRYTKAHREAMKRIVDSQYSQIVRGIVTDRGLTKDKVHRLIAQGPYTGKEALAAGLVDGLVYRDEVMRKVRVKAGEGSELLRLGHYLKRAGRSHESGQKAVALIYGVGAIVSGKSQFNPLLGQTMGSDTVSRAFRDAIDDEHVKAIVFRINSGGGSAVASEAIWRETIRAKKAGKPVIVSMGNVAGSGGYWVAMAADKIVVQPATITGSIGVVMGKMLTSGLYDKLGISWDYVQSNGNAGMWSKLTDFTPHQRRRLQHWLDHIYEEFTTRVAEGRKLPQKKVEKLAKGRIWTGEDALAFGLADKLGGMETAFGLALEAAEIKPDEAYRIKLFPKPRKTWEAWLEEEPENSGGLPEKVLVRALDAIKPVAHMSRQLGLVERTGILVMPDDYGIAD